MTADLSALSLMVVDDNRHMRALVRAMLRGFGIRNVLEAASAEQATICMHSGPLDIAIVDHLMPPQNGLEFVRWIRRSEASPYPMLPVIMMTGSSTRSTVAAARDAGVNEFVAKPVAAKALASRLWSVIARPRHFVQCADYFGPCRRRHTSGDGAGAKRRTDDQVDAGQMPVAP